jgi:hypothetical protein
VLIALSILFVHQRHDIPADPARDVVLPWRADRKRPDR